MNKKKKALPKRVRPFYRALHTNLPHLTKPQAITLAPLELCHHPYRQLRTDHCRHLRGAPAPTIPKHSPPTPPRVLQRRGAQSRRPTPRTGDYPLLRGAAALDCPPVDIAAQVPRARFRRYDPQATLHRVEYQRAVSATRHPRGVDDLFAANRPKAVATVLRGDAWAVARRFQRSVAGAGVLPTRGCGRRSGCLRDCGKLGGIHCCASTRKAITTRVGASCRALGRWRRGRAPSGVAGGVSRTIGCSALWWHSGPRGRGGVADLLTDLPCAGACRRW
jgi:hypothetical protein